MDKITSGTHISIKPVFLIVRIVFYKCNPIVSTNRSKTVQSLHQSKQTSLKIRLPAQPQCSSRLGIIRKLHVGTKFIL